MKGAAVGALLGIFRCPRFRGTVSRPGRAAGRAACTGVVGRALGRVRLPTSESVIPSSRPTCVWVGPMICGGPGGAPRVALGGMSCQSALLYSCCV